MSKNRRGLERNPKLPNACDECKRKKIRCDSELMPNNICSACINSDIICTHKRTQQRRGPKPWSVRTAASQPVNVIVAKILAATPSEPIEIPEDKEVTRKILAKLANRIRDLEEELNRILVSLQLKGDTDLELPPSVYSSGATAAEAVDSSSPAETSEETDNVENLTQQLSEFSFGHTRHGECSNLMSMMGATDHGKDLHGSNLPDWNSIFSAVKRPEFWDNTSWPVWYRSTERHPPLEFPPQSQLQQLVDAYFAETDVYTILLHRPTFEKSICEGLHLRDDAFGAVVLAVCALGANLLSPCPRSEITEDQWFCQIRLERFVFSPKLELHHLQLYCLYVFYLQSAASETDLSWLIVGVAIRRSQEKGAHKRHPTNLEHPTGEGELWKRGMIPNRKRECSFLNKPTAFWTLIIIDTHMTSMFGTPRAISIQDFDLDPLVECDDEYWEPTDSTQAFIQPEGIPSKISYWNSYLKLIEICGFALLTIYSVRKSELGSKMGIGDTEWYQKAVMELDSALNKWLDSVPEHLKWENQNDTSIFFSQSTILYSTYYWIQIQVHRRFIPSPGRSSSTSFPSLTICTNAARSCIRVCEAHYKKKTSLLPHFLMSLFGSAIVLILNVTRSAQMNPCFDPGKDFLDICRCIELVRLYENRYTAGGRVVDTINMIMYATFNPAGLTSRLEVAYADPLNMAGKDQVLDANTATTGHNTNSASCTPQSPSGPVWFGDFSLPTTDSSFYSNEPSIYTGHTPDNYNSEYITSDSHLSGSNCEVSLAYSGSTLTNTDADVLAGNLPDERMMDIWRNSISSNGQDWDGFMTGIGQLLNLDSTSGLNAFDLFNL
ncbi:Gypsy retrotransposon integrase-like protein 1 [Stygiomarasmius scandens]|uniref:Gypsy retrotransposon integrase-like protein 1 n=1 Tax=Marasmiellus scandens TaxID=2682957 RepID=A0ABR1JF08_9AGAR